MIKELKKHKQNISSLIADCFFALVISIVWLLSCDFLSQYLTSFIPEANSYFLFAFTAFFIVEVLVFWWSAIFHRTRSYLIYYLRVFTVVFSIALIAWLLRLSAVGASGGQAPGFIEMLLLVIIFTFYYSLIRPFMLKDKTRRFNFITAVAMVLVSLFVAEIGFRMVNAFFPQVLGSTRDPIEKFWDELKVTNSRKFNVYIDKKMGWRTSEFHHIVGPRLDAAGIQYELNYSTTRDGFRMFGDINTDKKKIFVIGDSFTQALEVSDSKTYYYHVGEILEAEIFAYGCGGYGSLQEYMILDQYIDQIDPDLVIIQFCCNDFINNCYEVEINSWVHGCAVPQPYLDKNGILFYAIPRKAERVREFALYYSECLYYILTRLDMVLSAHMATIEYEFLRTGPQHPAFQKAAEITEMIFEKITDRCESRELLFFSVDDEEPMYSEFIAMCEKKNFERIPKVSKYLKAREEEGVVIRAADKGHWNEMGHQLCGEKISSYIIENGLLPPPEPAKLEIDSSTADLNQMG